MATTPISTLTGALAVFTEAGKELTNAATVLASETADDAAKTAALATANAAVTSVTNELNQLIAAANALDADLSSPVAGP
jgi:uncharacterized membrane protein